MKIAGPYVIAEKVRSVLAREPAEREQPVKAQQIWEKEREVIYGRRVKRGFSDARTHSAPSGLCLSGGGVRSATFCLGVLQRLDQAGLLRAFDYLSTVSGGGFIGAWWTAWVHRHPTHKFPPAEQITFNRSESPMRQETAEWMSDCKSAGVDPVHHLRLYSNYLTPRRGLLSEDTWRAATTIARNLVLTLLVLLPFLFAVVLMADTYYVWQDTTWLQADTRVLPFSRRLGLWLAPVSMSAGLLVVAVLAWLEFARVGTLRLSIPYFSPVVLLVVGLSLYGIAGVTESAVSLAGFVRSGPPGALFGAWAVLALVLFLRLRFVPPSDEAVQWRHLAGQAHEREDEMRSRAVWWQVVFAVATCILFVVLGVAGVGHEIVASIRRSSGHGWIGSAVTDAGGWLALAAALAGSVYTGFRTSPSASVDARGDDEPSLAGRLALKFTPPIVLGVLLLLTALASHRAMGRVSRFAEAVRSAVPILSIGLGIFIATCAVYAWQESSEEGFDRERRRFVRSIAVVCWVLLATVALCTVARGVLTAANLDAIFPALPVNPLLWTLSGLATGCALFSLWLSTGVENRRPGFCLFSAFTMLALVIAAQASGRVPLLIAFAFLGNVLAWIMTFGWLVDPNRISLHSFYKNRLVRAYLGASNPERGNKTKYITQADYHDDMKLSQLASDIPAPYHLINATLNLVGGRDLKAAQRSSDRFLLSPLFCGSNRTLYRQTDKYMSDQMTLGTAVAISGAAISPTMGSLSPTAALAALMTLLNVRLGYWAPTPNKWEWKHPGATLWPVYAILELTSQTNELGSCCYLTDGGHFDNTGIYSLVERGCKHILCIDCGADPGPCFEDLGTAIRRCRIDFGTEIEVDLGAAMLSKEDRKHFIVGAIKYGTEHAKVLGMRPGDRTGVLIVIKPQVLHVDESADVRQYGLQNNKFPQQVTSDQWFDEAQFESYRKLGEISAHSFLAGLEDELKPFSGGAPFTGDDVQAFFTAARASYS